MIKNVVFDLGNVLLTFKPMEYLKSKLNDDKLAEKIYNIIFKSDEWIMLDNGVIKTEEATEKFCMRMRNKENIIKDVMNDWHNLLKPIDENIQILNDLKEKGYKIYILSNFHDIAFDNVYKKYDFFKDADGIVISAKIKCIKPEKEIFENLINTYKIKYEESIFIDDVKENVDMASSLGMDTIHLEDYKKLKEKLNLKGFL